MTTVLLPHLVLAHLAGDFLLQTSFEAKNKTDGGFWNKALFSHCLKYTATFLPAFVVFSINPVWLLLLLGSHLVLDRRWPVESFRHYVKGESWDEIKKNFWLTIVIDQIFHLIILMIIWEIS